MTSHGEVKTAETVPGEGVRAALEHDSFGSVVFHDMANYWLKDLLVGDVRDTITEGEVDGVVFPLADTNVTELTCTREVFAIFVERDGHDAVSSVESFFNAITVVYVDVNVEDALLVAEQLNDAEDDVYGALESVPGAGVSGK